MKFIHTADLHIGKSICEHSMLDEQRRILAKILELVDFEKPDAVLVAGDVYDKPVPSADAVAVLDDFLVQLSKTGAKVFVLSGNHDSAERIAFGGRLMENRGVYMSPVYSGTFSPVTLKDDVGETDVWMLPFVRPAMVRANLSTDEERAQVTDYTSATRMAISQMAFTKGRRNVLLAHQFVTGAERSDSEENVGGLDNVDASVFDSFDYVALGHIHKPQNVAKDASGVARVRYSGTPLKYSLSEKDHKKSVTVIELGKKAGTRLADIAVREISLEPHHDVREIRGAYAELVSPEYQRMQISGGLKLDDYVYIKLTDENDVPDAALKLRGVYPNLMMLDYDNERTRNQKLGACADKVEQKTPMELFGEFFSDMTNRSLNEEEAEFVHGIVQKIWEES